MLSFDHPSPKITQNTAFLTPSPYIKAVAGLAGQDKLAIALPRHVRHAWKHFPSNKPTSMVIT